MDSGFRQLDDRERELLKKLLSGRQEWRDQLASMTARRIIEDGTLELYCESGTPLPTRNCLVSEGVCRDSDGGEIQILLFSDENGFLSLLEILKIDSTPILSPPAASEMEVL